MRGPGARGWGLGSRQYVILSAAKDPLVLRGCKPESRFFAALRMTALGFFLARSPEFLATVPAP